jgi:hypothetical protein
MAKGVASAPGLPASALEPTLRQQVVFAISFKPRGACADWEQAQVNLRRTLRSALAAGTPGEASVVVACHDEPDLRDLGNDDVQLLPVPFREPAHLWEGVTHDKARKRRYIGAWLRRTLVDDETYVMFLDADDLVHTDLVEYVLAHAQGSYVVDRGYILDLASGLLWHRQEGFHQTCGSSFICRFARDEFPSSWEDAASPFGQFGTPPDQHGHEEYDAVATELGRPPAQIPFPAVVYTVNHSESLFSATTGGRRTISSPREVIWPAEAGRILSQEFSAEDLARRTAGLGRVSRVFTRAAGERIWAKARSRASGLRGHVRSTG